MTLFGIESILYALPGGENIHYMKSDMAIGKLKKIPPYIVFLCILILPLAVYAEVTSVTMGLYLTDDKGLGIPTTDVVEISYTGEDDRRNPSGKSINTRDNLGAEILHWDTYRGKSFLYFRINARPGSDITISAADYRDLKIPARSTGVTPDSATEYYLSPRDFNNADAFIRGMPNPAAVYCQQMGYNYRVEKTKNGERGICEANSEDFEEWDFYKGKVGKEYSYCARKGYDTISKIDNKGKYTVEYAVCAKDKEEKKMIEFMKENNDFII